MSLREWLKRHQSSTNGNGFVSSLTAPQMCVLPFIYLFSPPAFHEPCAARWKWNESSSPIFALSRSQARSFWKWNNFVIHPRPPKCSSFSFLCAEVALSILILAYMVRIIIYSVCKVHKTRIQCIQNPEGAAFSHNVPFFLVFYSLMPLVLRDRFCGLYIPSPEISPAVEWILNSSWSALLSRFS